MRFYESSIPIKRLELSNSRQEAKEGEVSVPQKNIWLENSKRRYCFSRTWMILTVIGTSGSMLFWAFLMIDVEDNPIKMNPIKVFLISLIFFCLVFAIQVLTMVFLFKSYFTIRRASDLLGLQTSEQTRQLCLMLTNTILIASSYFLWFVTDTTVMFLEIQELISKENGLVLQMTVRLFRLFCQMTAFTWILVSFAKYNIGVDREMERRRTRASFKKEASKPKPESVDLLETKPASAGLMRGLTNRTINDDDTDADEDRQCSDDNDSIYGHDTDEEDEDLNIEERLLQREIIKNFLAIKR